MTIPRVLPAMLGLVAMHTTAAILVMNVANAQTLRPPPSTVRTAASVASTFQVLMLTLMLLLFISCLRSQSLFSRSNLCIGLWFGSGLTMSLLGTLVSVVVVLSLRDEAADVVILAVSHARFLAATAVLVGIAFVAQILFLVVLFAANRPSQEDMRRHLAEVGDTSSGNTTPRVKATHYAQTATPESSHQSPPQAHSHSPFLAVAVQDTSRTRLVSAQCGIAGYPASPEMTNARRGLSDATDDFDSWDTSAVDPQSRQTVLEKSMPPQPRFQLETIPASPASPSFPPDSQMILERRLSFSAIPRPPPVLECGSPSKELHIHPLFRSNSPTPPAIATHDTVVVAAPDAGKVISQRVLHRMRSDSLPRNPSTSPSRQASRDSFRGKTPTSPGGGIRGVGDAIGDRNSILSLSFDLADVPEAPEDRTMTPPIPAWILNAGQRSSLTEYELRRTHDLESREGEADDEDDEEQGRP